MAIEVELPDGTVVEFPDGTPPAVMEKALASYRAPEQRVSADAEFARLQRENVEGMSGYERFMAGLGKSVADTGRGIGQLLGMVDEDEIAESRRMDAALMESGAGQFGNVAGAVGQTVIPAGASARIASMAGKAAPYVSAAVGSGAYSAAQGTVGDESRLTNAAAGAAAGAAGQALGAGVGRALQGTARTLDPIARKSLETLRQAGIPLHASQVSQSKALKTASSALAYLPGSGAGKAAQRQQEAVNRAVGRTFGAEAAQLSDEVMAGARGNLSGQYEAIFSGRNVNLDDKALSRLGQIEKDLSTRLTKDEAAIVRANIDKLLANTDNGAMPGGVYQSLRGDLVGRDGVVGKALKDVRSILDDAAFRSLGARDAAALKKLNGQWANMKTTEGVLKQVEGAKGNVRPAALWPAVRNGSTQEMRDLARAGQTVLKDPIPDSGTAGRLAVYSALAGAGGAGAMSDNTNLRMLGQGLLLGATAGRALNSQAAARLLSNGASPVIQGASRRIANAAPVAALAASNAAAADEPGLEIEITGGEVASPEDVEAMEAELEALREAMRKRRGY